MTAPNVFASALKRRRLVNTQAPQPPAFDPNDYSLGANNARNNAAMTGAGAAAGTANTDYFNRLESFDPSASIFKYASSAWDQAVNDPVSGLKRSLSDLRGGAVGAGRLDTGFFDQDQGDVIQNTTKNFQDVLGKTAIEGTRMQQANTQAIGEYGANQQNQYLDLLTAQREQQMNDARAKAERQRKKKHGIGSLIGTVLGGAVGSFIPGIGTAAGAGIGGQVGGGF